jgi:type IX secretion system PorP/SprF family membrane protein
MPFSKRFLILTLLQTGIIINCFSQESNIFNNAYLDEYIINPACTGSDYYPTAHSSVKKQWLGINDSPVTFFLGGDFRLGKYDFYDPKGYLNKGPLKLTDNIGLGSAVFRDSNGPVTTTGGMLSYAYHLPVNKYSRLSLGLSVLLIQHSLNTSILKPAHPEDQYLFNGDDRLFRANLGIGVYYHNINYFAGASIMKVFPDIIGFSDRNASQPSYFIFGGYKFNRNSNTFNFEPSACFIKSGYFKSGLDFHAKLYVKRLNWIAVSWKTNGNMNFQFAVRLYKMVYAGYNFEYSAGNISAYNMGSHEISLGINLGLVGVEGLRQSIKGADE